MKNEISRVIGVSPSRLTNAMLKSCTESSASALGAAAAVGPVADVEAELTMVSPPVKTRCRLRSILNASRSRPLGATRQLGELAEQGTGFARVDDFLDTEGFGGSKW